MTYLIKSNCEICGSEEGAGNRLVRDHNHKTGMIRGTLCDSCNSRVGIYESPHLRWKYRQIRKVKHAWWFQKFEIRVKEYLKQDTGIPYVSPRKERVVRETDIDIIYQTVLLDKVIQLMEAKS